MISSAFCEGTAKERKINLCLSAGRSDEAKAQTFVYHLLKASNFGELCRRTRRKKWVEMNERVRLHQAGIHNVPMLPNSINSQPSRVVRFEFAIILHRRNFQIAPSLFPSPPTIKKPTSPVFNSSKCHQSENSSPPSHRSFAACPFEYSMILS